MRRSSSRRFFCSSDRTRVPLPEIPMSLPGCRLSLSISSATFPPMSVELFHPSGSLRVVLRLEVGPLFVVHPPHQHGVRLAHSSSDLLSHLLVEVREVPFLRRLHDAVQRHELRRHDSPHKYLLRSILQTLPRPCIGHRGHAGDRARPTTTTSSHARPYGPSHSRSILPPRKTVMVEPL